MYIAIDMYALGNDKNILHKAKSNGNADNISTCFFGFFDSPKMKK